MKKILMLVLTLCLLLTFSSVKADYTYYYGNMTSDVERTYIDNYKVNKKWTIDSTNLSNVLKTPYVDSSKKIYDYSNILTDSEEKELLSKINNFNSKHNMEMVIVTVDLPYTSDSYNEIVAADFYDYNDFGLGYEHYDGILILRNTYYSDPYYDMYTFGNAQLYFDNSRYDDTLDDIYDDLHAGRYLSGFSDFIEHCDKYISKGIPYSYSDSTIGDRNEIIYGDLYYSSGEAYGRKPVPLFSKIIISGIITAIIYFIWLGINVKKCKMVIKATNANEYLIKNSINYTRKEDRFINSHTSKVRISSSSSGGGGGHGGHSSFGSSGGGHSSGGGRHG